MSLSLIGRGPCELQILRQRRYVGLAQSGFHHIERLDVGKLEGEGLFAGETHGQQGKPVTTWIGDRVAPDSVTSDADLPACCLEQLLRDHHPNLGLMVQSIP